MMEGELVARRSLLKGTYFPTDRRPPAEPFEKRALYVRPGTGAYLIVILLLSLGIWWVIWKSNSP